MLSSIAHIPHAEIMQANQFRVNLALRLGVLLGDTWIEWRLVTPSIGEA
jgi:hypothetical protein